MIIVTSGIVIVRLVSKQNYAYFSYVDNLYFYANLVVGMGMPTAVLKFCSGKNRKEDKTYILFAMKYGNLFQFFVSLLIVSCANTVSIPSPEARYLVTMHALYPC